jgi:hypothetical protein
MTAVTKRVAQSRPGRHVFLLDVLLEIRSEAERGRPMWLFFGAERFDALAAYITGYVFCCYRNGFQDKEWGAFMAWLRDVRKQMPEGWARKYVKDAGGDHVKAMMKFLNYVAEFRALPASRTGPSRTRAARSGAGPRSSRRRPPTPPEA